ncbi:MAG: hypothetical protein ACR2FS_10600 [Phormidesmis sp.]
MIEDIEELTRRDNRALHSHLKVQQQHLLPKPTHRW